MKSIFLISCLFLSGLALSQPISKLYVYSQEHTPGMIPEGESSGSHTRTVYSIYVSQSLKTARIQFLRIRLNNSWYKINSIDTVASPVYTEQPEKKLLVPATKNLLLQLNLGEPTTPPLRSVSTKAIPSIYYMYKGRNYRISCTGVVKLAPVLGI